MVIPFSMRTKLRLYFSMVWNTSMVNDGKFFIESIRQFDRQSAQFRSNIMMSS